MSAQFDEYRFRSSVDAAREQIKLILDTTRNPSFAADVPHKYVDKYLLAEYVVKAAISSSFTALKGIGLSDAAISSLRGFVGSNKSVTLRLVSTERCTFLREVKRDVESATKHVREVEGRGLLSGLASKITDKTVTTVTEYFWNFEVEYELLAFAGTDPTIDPVVLTHRKVSTEVMTPSKNSPHPENRVIDPIDLNFTWAVQHHPADFQIDRSDGKKCHTPRRNPEVESAFRFFIDLYTWTHSIHSYFTRSRFSELSKVSADGVFDPVMPLFEAGEGDQVLLQAADVAAFHDEQVRSLEERVSALAVPFPPGDGVKNLAEATLVCTVLHLQHISQHLLDGVNYIEDMLRKGLVAAIGKEVTPSDFAAYMVFHNRKLFQSAYEPTPFCYAVRRPDHYPEGTVSIESSMTNTTSKIPEPLPSIVRRIDDAPPMQFALDAATRVSLEGPRYLHSVIMHRFSQGAPPRLNLAARARQFSSFVLMVGRISAATLFSPKGAIIIKDKDDLKIPLLMEMIPTAKEFKDAISSLSPEQQRFAKAYRGLQLEGTLFGVCIVQIKPQMEKLLNLDDDSLTKEIKLTQDLQELFIKYQIPSDLLKYDGLISSAPEVKLAFVREQVAKMQEMIAESKKEQLEGAAQERIFSTLDKGRRPSSSASSLYSDDNDELLEELECAMAENELCGMVEESRAASPPKPSIMQRLSNAVSNVARSSSGGEAKVTRTSSRGGKRTGPTRTPSTELADEEHGSGVPVADEVVADVTRLPKLLDAKFEQFDEDNALRPTIINLGPQWNLKYQKGLLGSPSDMTVGADEQDTQRDKAFDLLDALSRSGALTLDATEFHIVVAATHNFDLTLTETVIQKNVNPIEKVERSVLVAASAIHNKPVAELIADNQQDRVRQFNAGLF